MVDVSSQNNSVSINVSTSGNSASIKATPDMAQYYSEKSREWATSNKIVDGVDYSSKYYANKANESATKAESAKQLVTEAKDGVIAEVKQEAQVQISTIQQVSQLEQEEVQEVINRIEEGKAVYMGEDEPTDPIYTVWVSPEDNNVDLEIQEIKEKLDKNNVDIDNIATDLSGKADVDLTNVAPTKTFANVMNSAEIRTVVETYQNGNSWYRVWSDNWCEQGGLTTKENVTLMKPMQHGSSGTYNVQTAPLSTSAVYNGQTVWYVSTTGFTIIGANSTSGGAYWLASGYLV